MEKLNLGCGKDIRPEYLNVDAYNYKGISIVSNVMDLNFKPESFTEILAYDVLEHLSFMDSRALLRRCYNWLKPNGTIIIHVPNLPYVAGFLADGGLYEGLKHIEALKLLYGVSAMGESNNPYRFHRSAYSKESLTKILRDTGYRIAEASVDCAGFGLSFVAFKEAENDAGK